MSNEPSLCLVIVDDQNNLRYDTYLLFIEVPELILCTSITLRKLLKETHLQKKEFYNPGAHQ